MEGQDCDKPEPSQPSTCSLEVESGTDEHGENVRVYYLDVPESEDAQVLDISNITNILSQEGIQIVEADGGLTEVEVDQSETQSAEALLNLSKSHGGQGQMTLPSSSSGVKLIDLVDVNSHAVTTEGGGEHVETEQITEPITATYVLDEDGTMVPLSEYKDKHGSNFLEVEEAGAQTVALCACWCGKEFYTQDELDKHKKVHSKRRLRGSAELKCELCNQVFNTSSKLASHHRTAHPDGMPWECPVCFRRFSKKLGLKVHLRAHSGLKQHKCVHCDRSFSYKNALLRHIRLHSKDKPYKCTVCGETFTHMWAMRRHRASHRPKQWYQCDICSKTFKQKTTFFIHARIHTGHRPYSCEICRKSFTLKSSLNQHLRIHTGEKPKICPVCDKAFRQTSTLRSHMALHNHVKPHKCRYCKKRFSNPEDVTKHEVVHLTNKAWQCDECGMRFRNQSLLARHGRKHTNERPFQCKVCGKSFSQSGSLQSHMRTHTKEKPYTCRLCPKTYTTSGTLLLHIRRSHNLDAKSVKDVFPSTHQVEDQKVFTIPTPAPNSTTTTTTTSSSTISTTTIVDDSVVSDVLNQDGLVFEEVVGDSHEEEGITTEDGNIIIQRMNPLSKESLGNQDMDLSAAIDANEVDDDDDDDDNGDDDDDESKSQKKKNKNAKELIRRGKRQVVKQGGSSVTVMNMDDSGQYKVVDMEKENSLYAQARQEAALGLAELSLVGGVVVAEKKPGMAYRTVSRGGGSDLEPLEDPSVTKIILSKEGGIMNSQDPHQCPICKRIFGRKSIMVEHQRIHTDEKPYHCDFCSAEFRQSAQLTCHILNRHTKEKLYHCTFCLKKFLSRSITIRHINFHHKLKLRVCEGMCPTWKIDDAIFVEKKELASTLTEGKSVVGGKGRPPKNYTKFGKKSNITILNSLAGLGSPTVKVKFGTEKKKVAMKSSDVVNKNAEPTIEYCTTAEVDAESNGGPESQVYQPQEEVVVKTEQTESDTVDLNQDGDDQQQETVIGTWYVCETCCMQFNTMESLRMHLRQVHNTTLAESDVSYVFEDEPSMESVNKEGQEEVEETTIPSSSSSSSTQVSANVVVETDNKPVELPKFNPNYVVVSDHRVAVGNGTDDLDVDNNDENQGDTTSINIRSSLKCKLCHMYCASRVVLEQHLMTHSNDEVASAGLYRCDTCGVVMKNTQQITKHILKVHGAENVYGCSICDKEFFQESFVIRHMRFFHKWEMKIRGEGNIPVLLKPASEHLKIPGAGDRNKVKGRVKVESGGSGGANKDKSDVKVTSRYENDTTFISLEVGDLDHLQLYREDGQEVRFEVVSSTDKATVIRIKDPQKEGVGVDDEASPTAPSSHSPLPVDEEEEDEGGEAVTVTAVTTATTPSPSPTIVSASTPSGQKASAEILRVVEVEDNKNKNVLASKPSAGDPDPKVSVRELSSPAPPPSKMVVIHQESNLVSVGRDGVEQTPRVVVVKEQGSAVSSIQEKMDDDEFGGTLTNNVLEKNVGDFDEVFKNFVHSKIGNDELYQNARKVFTRVGERNKHPSDVDLTSTKNVRNSLEEEDVGKDSSWSSPTKDVVCNNSNSSPNVKRTSPRVGVSALRGISLLSDVKAGSLNAQTKAVSEVVRVVEKSPRSGNRKTSGSSYSNSEESSQSHSCPATGKKQLGFGSSKVRTISVLKKSPLQTRGGGGGGESSHTNKAVEVKMVGKVTGSSITTSPHQDDNNSDIQEHKQKRRGRLDKEGPGDTAIQIQSDGAADRSSTTSTTSNVKVTPTKSPKTGSSVSKLKGEQVNAKVKATPTSKVPREEEEVRVSRSSSGRQIKRKRFADEEFETTATPRKYHK